MPTKNDCSIEYKQGKHKGMKCSEVNEYCPSYHKKLNANPSKTTNTDTRKSNVKMDIISISNEMKDRRSKASTPCDSAESSELIAFIEDGLSSLDENSFSDDDLAQFMIQHSFDINDKDAIQFSKSQLMKKTKTVKQAELTSEFAKQKEQEKREEIWAINNMKAVLPSSEHVLLTIKWNSRGKIVSDDELTIWLEERVLEGKNGALKILHHLYWDDVSCCYPFLLLGDKKVQWIQDVRWVPQPIKLEDGTLLRDEHLNLVLQDGFDADMVDDEFSDEEIKHIKNFDYELFRALIRDQLKHIYTWILHPITDKALSDYRKQHKDPNDKLGSHPLADLNTFNPIYRSAKEMQANFIPMEQRSVNVEPRGQKESFNKKQLTELEASSKKWKQILGKDYESPLDSWKKNQQELNMYNKSNAGSYYDVTTNSNRVDTYVDGLLEAFRVSYQAQYMNT